MGLLDDAIREHLELKRRRGADPGEVAREQREALDPVTRDSATDGDDESPLVTEQTDAADGEPVTATPTPNPEPAAAEDGADQAVAEETAELDMSSVLGDEGAADISEDESLEWEVPAGTSRAVSHDPEDGGVIDEHVGSQEPAEDVLEETPDFLRDTPEQERLWFEQRPPRDFDFDK